MDDDHATTAINDTEDQAAMERSVEWERYANIPRHPSGWGPLVKGSCAACGLSSLFLGEGGYVTCASLSCIDPTRTDALLHGEDLAARAMRLAERAGNGSSREVDGA